MNILCIWATDEDFSMEKHLNTLYFLVGEQCIGVNGITH